jgi:hypothetical protein
MEILTRGGNPILLLAAAVPDAVLTAIANIGALGIKVQP